MLNNHFADDSLFSLRADQEVIANARDCLSIFLYACQGLFSDNKTYYWLVRLEGPFDWIPSSWKFIYLGVIVRYLGIQFGVGLSPVAMWNWWLDQLQCNLHFW